MSDMKQIRKAKQKHFINRMMERFGVHFSYDSIPVLIEMIDSYESKPIIIIDNGWRSFHPFTIDGVDVVVLYCWKYQTPVTAYYPSWFKVNDGKNWEKTRGIKSKVIRKLNRLDQFEKKIKGF